MFQEWEKQIPMNVCILSIYPYLHLTCLYTIFLCKNMEPLMYLLNDSSMKISTKYLFYVSNQLFVSFQINEEISYLKYHLHLNPLMSDTTTRSGTAAGATASTWCRAPSPSPASAAGLWRTDPRRSRPRPRTARTRGRGGRRLRMATRRRRTERTKLSIRCVPRPAILTTKRFNSLL